ncbi:MAG: family aminopeptidase 2 [Acidimicrobiales bacterium]|nr:family aminopeptidase 2 [Acidimicrobiales bacterium]
MAVTDLSDALAMLAFVAAAPSPFHAVAEARNRLEGAGFVALEPGDPWPSGAGRHLFSRDGALVAWVVPDDLAPERPFRIIGAHTDSPNLRIKPHPDTGRAGWRQLGIEVYGGALLNSWLDRDLGLSGRVVVRGADGPEAHLVLVDRPLLRVPQLAIHLDRDVNSGLVLNPQVHLVPVWGSGRASDGDLARFLATELSVVPADVMGWDLMVHDLTPGCLLGERNDLLASARLDDLLSCWAAVAALIAVADAPADHASAICLFDHEEVGSQSATGADGALLAGALERSVLGRGGDRAAFLHAMAASSAVSADGAHATHPNYAERHEPDHWVEVNGGPVVKVNANQRYATDALSGAIFVAACERAGVPFQRFVSRTDMPCGSTIGPITAARLGIPVVDVGVAQLSMHSARELCGAADPGLFVRALTAYLQG